MRFLEDFMKFNNQKPIIFIALAIFTVTAWFSVDEKVKTTSKLQVVNVLKLDTNKHYLSAQPEKTQTRLSSFSEIENKFLDFDLKQLRQHLTNVQGRLQAYRARNFNELPEWELQQYNEIVRTKAVILKQIIMLRYFLPKIEKKS